MLSLFLDSSDACSGINTGMHPESLGITLGELPGTEAPRAGYLNTNRFKHEEADFIWLLERALKMPRGPVVPHWRLLVKPYKCFLDLALLVFVGRPCHG